VRGGDGLPGGDFSLKVTGNFSGSSQWSIFVNSNGGQGGVGQSGELGADGSNGANGTDDESNGHQIISGLDPQPGGNGSAGYQGGDGGNGGSGGNISIIVSASGEGSMPEYSNEGGAGGCGGYGGAGGNGGYGGAGAVRIEYHDGECHFALNSGFCDPGYTTASNCSNAPNGQRGPSGAFGNSGGNGSAGIINCYCEACNMIMQDFDLTQGQLNQAARDPSSEQYLKDLIFEALTDALAYGKKGNVEYIVGNYRGYVDNNDLEIFAKFAKQHFPDIVKYIEKSQNRMGNI